MFAYHFIIYIPLLMASAVCCLIDESWVGVYCSLSSSISIICIELFFQFRPELLGLCAFFVSIIFVYVLVFITVIAFIHANQSCL